VERGGIILISTSLILKVAKLHLLMKCGHDIHLGGPKHNLEASTGREKSSVMLYLVGL
jgi:hypothetical protein